MFKGAIRLNLVGFGLIGLEKRFWALDGKFRDGDIIKPSEKFFYFDSLCFTLSGRLGKAMADASFDIIKRPPGGRTMSKNPPSPNELWRTGLLMASAISTRTGRTELRK